MSRIHENLGIVVDMLIKQFDIVKIGGEKTLTNQDSYKIQVTKIKDGKAHSLSVLITNIEMEDTSDAKLFAHLIMQKFTNDLGIKV